MEVDARTDLRWKVGEAVVGGGNCLGLDVDGVEGACSGGKGESCKGEGVVAVSAGSVDNG